MRVVLHVDMDAFFAAIEERDKPRLRGLPIVVGSDPRGGKGRGVVSTANYAARQYGIKSALPISQAWELSQQAKKAGKPAAVFMGGNMSRYAEVSAQIMAYLQTKADLFVQASVDEAYLELATTFAKAKKVAQEIRAQIKKEFSLTCSIGVGPNKLIAKIAVSMEKPDGLTVIQPEAVLDFLAPLSVRVIPGVGPKAELILQRLGIATIADLRKLSLEEMKKNFGVRGLGLYNSARGINETEVVGRGEAKSVGHHRTFEKDTLDGQEILESLQEMIGSISQDIAAKKKRFKTVVVTVRFSDFVTKTRSATLPDFTASKAVLETEALKLLLPFLDSRENQQRRKLRLIGVRVEKFAPTDLFS